MRMDKAPGIWRLYAEETRNLLAELRALRIQRAEKNQRIEAAVKLFQATRTQLMEIKMQINQGNGVPASPPTSYSESLDFPGRSLA